MYKGLKAEKDILILFWCFAELIMLPGCVDHNSMYHGVDRRLDTSHMSIDQFQYIKILPKTVDLSTRIWGITTEFVWFIPPEAS